jgi:hypothetical protein
MPAQQRLPSLRTPRRKGDDRHEPDTRRAQPIARLIGRGHCLSNARIIKDQKLDDDWIEFEFADIDPRNLRRLVEPGEA